MRATPNLDFTTVQANDVSLGRFVKMIQKVYQYLTVVINGHLGFGDGTKADNLDGVWSNVVAPVAPNTDFTITHNLGRVPVGYWIMQKDRACDVYTGSVAATTTQLTLRATVASAVLRLFVIGLFLALFGVSVNAQTTNINLQVTDTASQSWNNGTWKVDLVSPPGVVPFGPPFFLINTTTSVPNQHQTGSLNSSGAATMTLTQNSGIAPSLSKWLFTVCSQATSQVGCYTQFVTVTSTTTLNLTPPPIVVQASDNARAYQDSEVLAGTGLIYYNLTLQVLRVCIADTSGLCTAWVTVGAGAVGAGLPNTAVAFSSTPSFNASTSASYTMPLTGNVTAITITGVPINGNLLRLAFTQDATGGRLVTFPGNFIFPIDYAFRIQALSENDLLFHYDGANWHFVENIPDGALDYSTVGFSATPTFSNSRSAAFDFTLTGNVTSSTFTTTGRVGTQFVLNACQDGVGGRTFAFPGNVSNPQGFAFDITANHCNRIYYYWNGTQWIGIGGGSSIQASVAIKPTLPGDPIQYVSPNGNNANDGLSIGSAKLTVYEALKALPGGNSTTAGFGTVLISGTVNYGGPAANQGMWLMGGLDPNFGSPPTGWLKFAGAGGLTLDCYATVGGAAHSHETNCGMGGGGNSDSVHPAVWISATTSQIVIRHVALSNFLWTYIKYGIDSNNNRNGTGGASGFSMDGVSWNHGSPGVGAGPGMDIGSNSFWIWLKGLTVSGAASGVFTIAASPGASRTSNVATITTTTANNVANGDTVTITNVTDDSFNGSFVVTSVPNNTHFTYANLGANATSGTGQVVTAGAAAINIDSGPTGSGSGLIFIDDINLNNGNIRFKPGINGGGVYVRNVSYEGSGVPDPPTILVTNVTTTSIGGDQIIRVDNVEVSDNFTPVAAVQVDNASYFPDVVIVSRIAGPLRGSMTVLGGSVPSGTATSLRKLQYGLEEGQITATGIDVARRGFSPVVVPGANIATTNPSGWTFNTGTGTITGGFPAPDGTNGAGRVTGSGQAFVEFFGNTTALNLNDVYIFGVWIRAVNGTLANNPPIKFVFNTHGFGVGDACFGAAGSPPGQGIVLGNRRGQFISDGQWQWYSGICKVAANPTSPGTSFDGFVDSTHAADFYAPVMMLFPAGTISDNESWEIANNLSSFPSGVTAGTIAMLRGQKFAMATGAQFLYKMTGSPTADHSVDWPNTDGQVVLNTATGIKSFGGYATTPTSTKTSAYTITANDNIIPANAVGGGFTISLNPAIVGAHHVILRTDNVPANILTIAPTSGSIDGTSSTTLSALSGMIVTCDGVNCQVEARSAGGGGPGSTTPATQYSFAFYCGVGTSSTLCGVAAPVLNSTWKLVYQVTGGVALAPVLALDGIAVLQITGNTSLDSTYRAADVRFSSCITPTLTLPAISGTTASNLPFTVTNGCSGNLTITSTSPNSINNGSPGNSVTLFPGQFARLTQDNTPGWWTSIFTTTNGVPTNCTALTNSATLGFVCATLPVVGGTNLQTGNYTALTADDGKTISMNGTTLTLTLPAAAPSATWKIFIENRNASSLTVNRNGLNIDGAASNITVPQNQGFYLTVDQDGVNYSTSRGLASATAGVNNWSGDGVIYTNTNSTGNVTGVLGNAGANTVLGRPTGSSGAPSYSALVTGQLPAQALTKLCDIIVGDTSGSAITNAQLGPQKRICQIPKAATVVQITVASDAGTPNVIVGRSRCTTFTAAVCTAETRVNLTSAALAAATGGFDACSTVAGGTGIDGGTTCSSTLQNTGLNAGDYLELVSGTAGGTAKLMTIHIYGTFN